MKCITTTKMVEKLREVLPTHGSLKTTVSYKDSHLQVMNLPHV